MIDLARWSPAGMRGRLARRVLGLLPRHAIVRVMQGPLAGARWVVGSGPHSYWLGCYEPDMQRAILHVTRPGNTAFDVGAHAGFFTLMFARIVGAAGRVHAFEPLEGNVASLEKHVRLNRAGNITIHAMAVSDSSGEERFCKAPHHSMGRLVAAGGDTAVATVSIDDFVFGRGNPPPNVIKMDIEGAEGAALRGMRGVLTRCRPVVLIAFHGEDVRRECLDLFGLHGYVVSSLLGGGLGSDACEAIAVPCERQQEFQHGEGAVGQCAVTTIP